VDATRPIDEIAEEAYGKVLARRLVPTNVPYFQ
jgi:hypothetical protein